MSKLLFDLSSASGLADDLCLKLGYTRGKVQHRSFPDDESYLRLLTPVAGKDVILLCTLDHPDTKIMPLLFSAAAARAQGALSVGLVAPYLAYMRQDKAFEPGEAVTSAIFAKIISSHIDWLVTLDPHLHRHESLGAIYSVPAIAVSAAESIGDWVRKEVNDPVLIGPDEESRRWVERAAEAASAPIAILCKSRTGDQAVSITDEALADLPRGTPVVIDDIASTSATMIETIEALRKRSFPAPVCVIVHPIFAGDSYASLLNHGPARVVSTNSIGHRSNEIDIAGSMAAAIVRLTGEQ